MDILGNILSALTISLAKKTWVFLTTKVSKWGVEFHQDIFIDYTPRRPDLQIWDYERNIIKEGVEIIWYPLVSRHHQIWWCDIPSLYVYDSEMLYLIGVLFSEVDDSGCQVVGYFSILLAWCTEGSHGLCTKEAFDILVIASRLTFSKRAIHYCLRWSHHYLLTLYGNDYHLVIPSYEENKIAYLAYEFIQLLEIPYTD